MFGLAQLRTAGQGLVSADCRIKTTHKSSGKNPLSARLSLNAAQVGMDNLAMRANLGRRSRREHLAQIEHGDAVADVEDQVGMVLHQEHPRALPADGEDELA